MTALITTVLVASLLGSLHCAGMCGPFVAFAVGATPTRTERIALHIAYNGGRLVTYTLLGAISGLLGAVLDLGGALVGLQRFAAVLAGLMMVAVGVVAVMRYSGVRLPPLPLPGGLVRLTQAGHTAALALRPVPRALVIGLLTTLLPCGWLYAFAITAAGTASPLWGALTMMTFWVGTLPVLISLGAVVQQLAGALGRRLPLLTSLAIVVVGVYTVGSRLMMGPRAYAQRPPIEGYATVADRHDERPSQTDTRAATDVAGAIERVRSLDAATMPCCQHDQSPATTSRPTEEP